MRVVSVEAEVALGSFDYALRYRQPFVERNVANHEIEATLFLSAAPQLGERLPIDDDQRAEQ